MPGKRRTDGTPSFLTLHIPEPRARDVMQRELGYCRMRPPVKPITVAELASLPTTEAGTKAVVRVELRPLNVALSDEEDLMPKIAILHTSLVFISVEPAINNLIGELIPSADVIHFVDSDVLATVIREQGISPASETRMTHLAQAAEAARADIIFSACSSLGPALDVAARSVAVPVVKIDEAMATEAVRRGARIGVLATVPTTLRPTSDLVKTKAATMRRTVSIKQRLCEGAFDVLMSGDRARHDAMVTEQAVALAKEVDVIVLAQASMARLAGPLQDQTKIPVLSSPRLGVEYLAKRVAALGS